MRTVARLMSAIEFRKLTKWYGRARGVEDLTFSVERGEIFGYLGPNGSGKTTTIRCALGFLAASSGETRLFGEVVRAGRATQHERIGFLPGDFRTWPDLTARKSLRVLEELGVTSAGGSRRDELAERLNLNLDRRVSELSKGNRQKVGIVLAFQHRPELLILDEPTTGLDPLVRQTVLELIREEASRGATVFLSSHDLAEVAATCDRAAILRQGRMAELAPISRILMQSEYRVVATFAGAEAPAFPAAQFPAVRVERVERNQIRFVCHGPPDALIKWLAHFEVERLSTPEPTLEEAFMQYYAGEAERA
jgi:ABC-2 type transport system ATP-binding protein